MGSGNRDNYSFLLALISGGVFGLSMSNSFISSIALIGGFISWIWIAEVLKKRMYANATPSAPVTSFNQISLVFAPIIITGMIFFVGGGISSSVGKNVQSYQSHQEFEKKFSGIQTQRALEPTITCDISGKWISRYNPDSYYIVNQDGSLDCYRDNKQYKGQYSKTGNGAYEFRWDVSLPNGKQLIDIVTIHADCQTLYLINNASNADQAIRE